MQRLGFLWSPTEAACILSNGFMVVAEAVYVSGGWALTQW